MAQDVKKNMVGFIKKSMEPLVLNLDVLILFSLWIAFFKTILNIISGPMPPGAILLFQTFLFGGQILTFAYRKKIAWMLSAVQVIALFFYGIGTFGYLITFLLNSFSIYQPVQTYLVSAFLLIGEIAKTFYIYRTRSR